MCSLVTRTLRNILMDRGIQKNVHICMQCENFRKIGNIFNMINMTICVYTNTAFI